VPRRRKLAAKRPSCSWSGLESEREEKERDALRCRLRECPRSYTYVLVCL
jgi:hypothetical protein